MRIGIDLGGTKIEGIALADDGAEVARKRIAAPRDDYRATLRAIAGLVADLEVAAGRQGPVGVGIPGTVSPATGLVKNANSTWLIGHPFDRDLADVVGRPVRLANDANCFALSEAADGAAAGANVVFGVILGTGVGGGLIIEGKVLTGHNAIAGEWGHNPQPWPAPDDGPARPCYCGQAGCIETYLSGPALAADHARVTGNDLTSEEIAANAAAGDAACTATLDRYVLRLAKALASVLNVFDPDVVVLGGGLSNIERVYRDVPTLWQDYAFTDQLTTRLVAARHGDSSGVRGAAWLWPEG